MSKIVEKIKEKEPRNGWWNRVIAWWEGICVSKCEDKKTSSLPKYHALTPIDDVDCDVYLDALQEALLNNDVKNIAITGPYGSGKSSVIRTFFSKRNQNGQFKLITITLANFISSFALSSTENNQEAQKDDGQQHTTKNQQGLTTKTQNEEKNRDTTVNGEVLEKLIERSIVQQLFYHEKDKTIPNSHFKKIHKETEEEIAISTLFVVLILLSVCVLVFPSEFWSLPIIEHSPKFFREIIPPLSLVMVLVGLWNVIKHTRTILHRISAMKFRNTEVVLNKDEEKSILNHYIDEIIYYFEATEKNVVVLEDLDRFNHYEIFTKLREINYLINNCDKIQHKVVFIYALKDDIFKDTDRTKFFDFIIPIIPIINSSNSGEIFRHELPVITKNAIKDYSTQITEELVDDLSLFIDDMRLIYNIVNEYKIYSQIVVKNKLIANRLLTIIVYKNLYPDDFAALSRNEGVLYNLVREQRNTYREELIQNYQNQIKEKQARLKEIDTKDRTLSEKELRLVYLTQIVNHLNRLFVGFLIGKKKYSISQCAENDTLFQQVILMQDVQYTYQQESNYYQRSENLKVDWALIQNEINPKQTYEQRLALLHQSEISSLNQEIKELEHNIEECKHWTICELLNHKKIKETDKTNATDRQTQLDFINIALRNDYINENYWEYISIYHEGSLTPSDKEFVLNVKVHRNTPFNHPLQRNDNVLAALTKEYGTRPLTETYALNNDLMDYILSETGDLYITPYIQTTIRKKDFIMQYIERGKNLDLFLNNICIQWPLFWDFICEHKSTEINKYLRLILENVLEDNLVSFFKDRNEHINRFADFMLLNVDEQKKHDIIEKLDLHFEDLNPDTSIDDKRYIYETCAYALRPKVMRVIISAMPNWDERMYNTRNFSYIKEEYPKMFEYIQNNIAEYICNVFLQLEENSDILQDDFVDLLNNENIKDEQKKLIISQCNIKIEGVSVIESVALRSEICRQNKMTATWENVRCILNSQEVNLAEECIAFLNVIENAEQLSEQKLTDELDVLDDSDKTTISYTIIHFADLTIGAYSLLLHAFIGSYSSFKKDTLDEYRMRLLIDNKLVSTNKAAYLYLKGNYNGLHIYLLEKNVAEFKDTYQELKFDANDINIIIQSTAFNNSTKQEIINSISVKEVFAGEEDAINSLVKWLLSDGVHESEALKPEIMNFISQQSFIDISARKKLYLKYSDSISEMVPFLTNLGEPYSLMIGSGDKVVFSKEEADLLKLLRRKGYISKWTHMRTTGRYHVRREHIHI